MVDTLWHLGSPLEISRRVKWKPDTVKLHGYHSTRLHCMLTRWCLRTLLHCLQQWLKDVSVLTVISSTFNREVRRVFFLELKMKCCYIIYNVYAMRGPHGTSPTSSGLNLLSRYILYPRDQADEYNFLDLNLKQSNAMQLTHTSLHLLQMAVWHSCLHLGISWHQGME